MCINVLFLMCPIFARHKKEISLLLCRLIVYTLPLHESCITAKLQLQYWVSAYVML